MKILGGQYPYWCKVFQKIISRYLRLAENRFHHIKNELINLVKSRIFAYIQQSAIFPSIHVSTQLMLKVQCIIPFNQKVQETSNCWYCKCWHPQNYRMLKSQSSCWCNFLVHGKGKTKIFRTEADCNHMLLHRLGVPLPIQSEQLLLMPADKTWKRCSVTTCTASEPSTCGFTPSHHWLSQNLFCWKCLLEKRPDISRRANK